MTFSLPELQPRTGAGQIVSVLK